MTKSVQCRFMRLFNDLPRYVPAPGSRNFRHHVACGGCLPENKIEKNSHPKKAGLLSILSLSVRRWRPSLGGRRAAGQRGAGRSSLKSRERSYLASPSSERGNQPTCSCLFLVLFFSFLDSLFIQKQHMIPSMLPAGRAERGIPMAGWELIASNHPLCKSPPLSFFI